MPSLPGYTAGGNRQESWENMFDRMRRGNGEGSVAARPGTVGTPGTRGAPYQNGPGEQPTSVGGPAMPQGPGHALADRRERQRSEFGGLNLGAAFFGWLVAIGLGVLLVAILSAAGTAIGITEIESVGEATDAADTIGIVGGILLFASLLIAYFAGGYVAGRMSRFDGARQGFGVWAVALVITLAVAAAGALLGAKYNIFAKLDLPRIPVDEGTLTTGGAIALVAILIGTLIAAILGGKTGERYHRKVDRVGVPG